MRLVFELDSRLRVVYPNISKHYSILRVSN